LVSFKGTEEEGDGHVLIVPGVVVEPAELLEGFGVLWVEFEDHQVVVLGGHKLLLHLVHVTDLEEEIGLRQRSRRASEDRLKVTKTLLVLAELLVDVTETKVDLVGLLETRAVLESACEGVFSDVVRATAIVQDADAIPKM